MTGNVSSWYPQRRLVMEETQVVSMPFNIQGFQYLWISLAFILSSSFRKILPCSFKRNPSHILDSHCVEVYSDFHGFFFFFLSFFSLFGCARSSLLHKGFLQLHQGGFSLVAVCSLLFLWSTGTKHLDFSSQGAHAQLPSCMGNLPRPWMESVSPAFTGGF